MGWDDIRGHDQVLAKFRCAVDRGRLASTFLFVGPAGIGKRTFALRLAQALLCETNPETVLDPCGHCDACQQVEAGTHPDLEQVKKPKDRAFIPVDVFIGDREHRMREGLCHNIALKPFRGGRKVAIIDDADHLKQEGANCLLKTLEEPPPKSVIILIGTSSEQQLPTIRSRSQIIRFDALSTDVVTELLLEQELADSHDEAYRLASLSGGSIAQALAMNDPEISDFRSQLLEMLSAENINQLELARQVTAIVEAAGKDAPARRARLRQVVTFTVDYLRQVMRGLTGQQLFGDPELVRHVKAGISHWRHDSEAVAGAIDRCLDTFAHIAANANQTTVIECWIDELATIARDGRCFVSG